MTMLSPRVLIFVICELLLGLPLYVLKLKIGGKTIGTFTNKSILINY